MRMARELSAALLHPHRWFLLQFAEQMAQLEPAIGRLLG
jgi:hypothetical protein